MKKIISSIFKMYRSQFLIMLLLGSVSAVLTRFVSKSYEIVSLFLIQNLVAMVIVVMAFMLFHYQISKSQYLYYQKFPISKIKQYFGRYVSGLCIIILIIFMHGIIGYSKVLLINLLVIGIKWITLYTFVVLILTIAYSMYDFLAYLILSYYLSSSFQATFTTFLNNTLIGYYENVYEYLLFTGIAIEGDIAIKKIIVEAVFLIALIVVMYTVIHKKKYENVGRLQKSNIVLECFKVITMLFILFSALSKTEYANREFAEKGILFMGRISVNVGLILFVVYLLLSFIQYRDVKKLVKHAIIFIAIYVGFISIVFCYFALKPMIYENIIPEANYVIVDVDESFIHMTESGKNISGIRIFGKENMKLIRKIHQSMISNQRNYGINYYPRMKLSYFKEKQVITRNYHTSDSTKSIVANLDLSNALDVFENQKVSVYLSGDSKDKKFEMDGNELIKIYKEYYSQIKNNHLFNSVIYFKSDQYEISLYTVEHIQKELLNKLRLK